MYIFVHIFVVANITASQYESMSFQSLSSPKLTHPPFASDDRCSLATCLGLVAAMPCYKDRVDVGSEESSCWVGGHPYAKTKGGAIFHGGGGPFPKKNNGVKQLSLLVN